jgi:hypothetical protein
LGGRKVEEKVRRKEGKKKGRKGKSEEVAVYLNAQTPMEKYMDYRDSRNYNTSKRK